MNSVDIALWVLAGVLAAGFAVSGLTKVVRPRQQLADMGMEFVEDFGDGAIKQIGALEVLGAVGLILPALVGIGARFTVPLAATGLAALMFGAVLTHARRREPQGIVVASLLLVLSVLVATGRGWLAPFGN